MRSGLEAAPQNGGIRGRAATASTIVATAALLTGLLPCPAARAQAKYVPDGYDLAGSWLLKGTPHPTAWGQDDYHCWTQEVLVNYEAYGQDHLDVSAVSARWVVPASSFDKKHVEITYQGTYHHVHAFGRSAEIPGTATAPARTEIAYDCLRFPVAYAVSGTLKFFPDDQTFLLDLQGDAVGTPPWRHATHVAIAQDYYGSWDYGPYFPVLFPGPDADEVALNVSFGGAESGLAGTPEGCPLVLHDWFPTSWDIATCSVTDWGPQAFERGNLAQFLGVKADLQGDVVVRNPDGTLSTDTIPAAEVRLYRQQRHVRDAKEGESPTEYAKHLSRERSLAARTSPDANGRFRFPDVPVLESLRYEAWYTVEVSGAHGQYVMESGMPAEDVFFLDGRVTNARAGETLTIGLVPTTAVAQKRRLAQDLGTLLPIHYGAIEGQVQSYLDGLDAGSPALTPARLEGVRRAVLAERVAMFGARAAQEVLGAMVAGVAKMVDDLVDDYLDLTSGALADQKQRFNDLEESFEKAALEKKRFVHAEGFTDSALQARRRLEAEIGGTSAVLSMLLEKVKDGVKLTMPGIASAMVLAGVDPETADSACGLFQKLLFTLLDAGITQSLSGMAKELIKQQVADLVQSYGDDLLDGPVASWGGMTQEGLEASRTRMEAWDEDDAAGFQADRSAVNASLRAIDAMLVQAQNTSDFALGFSEASGHAEEAMSLAEPFFVYAKIAKKVATVLKYLLNAVAVLDPMITAYHALPEEVRIGMDRAYGIGGTAARSPMRRAASAAALYANAALVTQLQAANGTARASLEALAAALRSGWIDDAIVQAYGAQQGEAAPSVMPWKAAREAFDAAVKAWAVEFGARLYRSGPQAARMAGNLALPQRAFEGRLALLFVDTLAGRYRSPDDPAFVLARNRVLADLAWLRSTMQQLTDAAAALQATTQVLPSVAVLGLTVTSDATGRGDATQSGETFSVRARVRNLATVAVAGLQATLSTTPAEGAVTVTGSASQAPGGGALAAEDGTVGSGADEADVSWTVTWTGGVASSGPVRLAVALSQEPADAFLADGEAWLLPAWETMDGNGDGLPDAWQSGQGIAGGAAADDDGDGLTNAEERLLGTAPSEEDSDGDGLEDGEEVVPGLDGFVTDPLEADGDGDGVGDAEDGDPGDAGTTGAPATAWEEPEVTVSVGEVTLTETARFAVVQVLAPSKGTLRWTAMAEDESLCRPSPGPTTMREGAGELVLGVPLGFDFAAAGPARTRVHVVDVGGLVADEQVVTVHVGTKIEVPGDADGTGEDVPGGEDAASDVPDAPGQDAAGDAFGGDVPVGELPGDDLPAGGDTAGGTDPSSPGGKGSGGCSAAGGSGRGTGAAAFGLGCVLALAFLAMRARRRANGWKRTGRSAVLADRTNSKLDESVRASDCLSL